MKHTKMLLVLLLSLLLCACGAKKEGDGLLLHLSFDEGKGTQVQDVGGQAGTGELAYVLTKTPFGTNQDPQWRSSGVAGGSLLFDGCSNAVSFTPEQVLVSGQQFSVSVWAAPRTFEWDDPNAASSGNEHLTAIAGQYNKGQKQGFLLGYQRFGRLCFQVGTGDSWVTVWADANLQKYEWNYITAEFDGTKGTVSLCLNGEQVGSASVPTGSAIAPADREKLLVGKNAKGEAIAAGIYNMFSGMMDELKLYSRPLTDAERTPAEAPAIAYTDIALQNVLTDDIYKTQYHGGPYQHWMNEPHAPVYYNGMYHLFFQQNMTGTYWRNICWGHLVSQYLVNWRPVKEAITPTENTVVPDGVWSGGATLDKNGVPLLFFTAGNDSFAKERMISNQNIGLAYPKDLSDPELTDWVIYDSLAIEQQAGQGRPGEFRDSHIWKEDDTWYMLVCSGSSESDGGTALLYETKTLELLPDGTVDMNWVYRGPIFEMEKQPITFGTSWELPILLPFTNEAGMTRYAFFISPAPASVADNKVYYFMGDFDKETGKFTPDAGFEKPHLLDYGSNVFTGPSMFVDPVSGEIYCVSIMQDQRNGAEEGASDWAHCVGLTRKIWLNDEGTDLMMAPIDALHTLEGAPIVNLGQSDAEQTADEILQKQLSEALGSASLEEANAALAQVDEDMLYLRLSVELNGAQEVSLHVKSGGEKDDTVFTYSAADGTISATTRNRGKAAKTGFVSGPLEVKDGVVTMEVYIDRSLVEAYFNDTKSISVRSYADFASRSIFLEADGDVTVVSLYAASMKSIYT